jgi:hypothetical protein
VFCLQEKMLSTLLFGQIYHSLEIYINDLPDYIKHSKIRLFADDSIIYRPIKTQADCIKLQEDLESAVKIYLLWTSFVECDCSILNLLIV